jgi:hypothetical protein
VRYARLHRRAARDAAFALAFRLPFSGSVIQSASLTPVLWRCFMRRMIWLVLTCAVVVGFATPVSGQSRRRMEVGGQFSAMRLSRASATDAGIGGRFAWILNDTFALEAVSDFFPTGRYNVIRGGGKFHLLGGPKLGWRFDRIGVFAKTRAGVARIGEGKQEGVCAAISPTPEGCLVAENRLAFDIGGGVEIHSTRRSSIRFDIGDLMTRVEPRSSQLGPRRNVLHNLQVTAGLAVKF